MQIDLEKTAADAWLYFLADGDRDQDGAAGDPDAIAPARRLDSVRFCEH